MNSKKKEIWTRIRSQLKLLYPPEEIDLWFSGTELFQVGDGSILVKVPNRFVASWIKEHYIKSISELTKTVLGQKLSVELVVKASQHYPKIISPLESSYTFENFIIETNNKFAYHCVRNLIFHNSSKIDPIFIFGNSGVGKTHLLCATANLMLKKDIYPCYISNQILNQYKRMEAINQSRDSWDALLMDDIHLISGNYKAHAPLINLFDHFYENNLPVLFTSRVPPVEIQNLDRRLLSRLTSCLIAPIGPLGQETMVAILSQAALERKVHVPSDVLFFLASSGKVIKELKKDLSRIISYLSIRPGKIDISTAKGLIENRPYEPTPQTIQNLVAQYFDLPPSFLVSEDKSRQVTHARQVAMYLCRKLTDMSLKEIANFFGRKDHSTVIYAINKIDKRKKEDLDLQKALEWLISNFL